MEDVWEILMRLEEWGEGEGCIYLLLSYFIAIAFSNTV